jgi:hypothetical protein
MRHKILLAFLIGIIVQVCGCESNPPTTTESGVSVMVYDASLYPYAPLWQTELDRRFKVPTIALLLHGGGPVAQDWVVQDNRAGGYGQTCESATVLVDRIHNEHPDCVIVLLACNPSHVTIHDRPWLFYSPASVWCVPDRAVKPFVDGADTIDSHLNPNVVDNRSTEDMDAVGNAYELIEGN